MPDENGDSGKKPVRFGSRGRHGLVAVPATQHLVLHQNDRPTPLGRLALAGQITGGRGIVPARPLRVFGSYAVMCVLKGEGSYQDADGARLPVSAGDVVLVFPERAHWYGPPRPALWDELYISFDGPVFDLWRQAGLLDPLRPVLPGGDRGEAWSTRLRALLAAPEPDRVGQICGFVGLLGDLLLPFRADAPPGPLETSSWLSEARGLLETDLGRALDLEAVARAAGMSYESFRKRFQKETSVSPARFRTVRRIETARELLRYTPQMTNRQVAESLGFSDEYHFSKRFRQVLGLTPRQFRQQLAGGR